MTARKGWVTRSCHCPQPALGHPKAAVGHLRLRSGEPPQQALELPARPSRGPRLLPESKSGKDWALAIITLAAAAAETRH